MVEQHEASTRAQRHRARKGCSCRTIDPIIAWTAPRRRLAHGGCKQLEPSRAARQDRLAPFVRFEIAIDLYREELRKTLASIKHQGAGGLTTFDAQGDTLSPIYFKVLREGKMRPLDPRD